MAAEIRWHALQIVHMHEGRLDSQASDVSLGSRTIGEGDAQGNCLEDGGLLSLEACKAAAKQDSEGLVAQPSEFALSRTASVLSAIADNALRKVAQHSLVLAVASSVALHTASC